MNSITNQIRNILLSIFLITFILSGCSKDTDSSSADSSNTPNIVNVTYSVDEREFVIEATDDKGIEGYLLTLSNEKPELDDSYWKTSEELSVRLASRNAERNINYYIWVKDLDGNLSSYEFYLESDIVYFAENYDHLQWYLDNPYSKIVDGVTYDIQALKEEYGDLYRFVEPLSKEDVEGRFKYLAELLTLPEYENSMFPGGVSDITGESFTDYNDVRFNIYEKIAKTTDDTLVKYKEHYWFVEKVGDYREFSADSIYTQVNDESEIINIIDKIPFEDKDWFVRSYATHVDILLKTLEENEEEPKFVFKIE